MKKPISILALLSLFLLPGFAQGQTWYPVDQATMAWDPVAKLVDGSPIPAGSTVQYVVYSKQGATGTPKQEGQPTPQTQMTVTFTSEGQFFLGVKAQRLVGGNVVSESPSISWSDDPAVTQNGQTWGIMHYLGLEIVKGLRKP